MGEINYSASEERLNVISHAFGILLSIIGLALMISKSNSILAISSSLVFGISLIILYTASTFYHSSRNPKTRSKLRVFDHAAIYILIAGTYTPVCLITLQHSIGGTLLIFIWSIGITGVILKLFFTGKFGRASTILYVAMGWVAIVAVQPLLQEMNSTGLIWLLLGGLSYTIGAILYSIKSIAYNHAIFHLFVLGGSFSHFIMIYSYVI